MTGFALRIRAFEARTGMHPFQIRPGCRGVYVGRAKSTYFSPAKIQSIPYFSPRKSLGFAPDYWALHPTTGLCTRLLGFAPDYWALHPTTGLCIRLLDFAPDYWALHPTTGLCTRRLGFAPDDWAKIGVARKTLKSVPASKTYFSHCFSG